MKNITKILSLLCAGTILVSCSACDFLGQFSSQPESSSSGKIEGATYTVILDLNYEGAQNSTVTVKEDEDGFAMLEEPTAPVREHYAFGGWFLDKACTDPVDFDDSIDSNVTFYAKWTQSAVEVIFNYNYEGATPVSSFVAIGESVTQPTAPKREGYMFDGWYQDQACTEGKEFDFTSVINTETSVYAKWTEIKEDDGTVTLTYMWNYTDAANDGVYDAVSIIAGKKTTAPTASREGYHFDGWYTEAECSTEYDFSKRVNESATLYAKWMKIHTFEAEMTDFSSFSGFGYSGSVTGWSAVFKDKFDINASNGFFVTGLYDKDLSITFEIYSEKAVSDAYITLRLSCEFDALNLTDDEFLTTVNGEKVSFGQFSISLGGSDKAPFADYRSTSRVSLKEGANTIKLTVNNANKGIGGTMYAAAPMVDCIYVYSTSTVTWNESLGFPLETYKDKHTA